MAPSRQRFDADLEALKKANKTLEEAVHMKFSAIVRDGTIQRFEYVFELSWKTIQAAGAYMGTVCNTPRDAIRAAYKLGWINDTQPWFDAQESRNQTSHTYNETIAGDVFDTAKSFAPIVHSLIESLSKVQQGD